MNKIKLMIICTIILMFSGCLYKTEISSNIIVDIIGVQYTDNKYKLHFYQFNEDEDIITASGETVEEAIQNAQINKNKNVFLQQTSTLIIDKSLYKEDIKEILQDFSNPKNYNLQTDVYTTDALEEIFNSDNLMSLNNSKYNKIIDYDKKHYMLNKKMVDILVGDYGNEKIAIPHITLKEDKSVTILGESFFYNNVYIKDIPMNDIIVKEILTGEIKNTYMTLNISDKKSVSIFIQKSMVKEDGDVLNIDLEIEKPRYDNDDELKMIIESNVLENIKTNKDYIDDSNITSKSKIKISLIYQ